jgi:hypothetical protein
MIKVSKSEDLLVRMIALSCFACFTALQRLFLEAGSNPVLGSSMYTTWGAVRKCQHAVTTCGPREMLDSAERNTLASPIREMATLRRLLMPPLYFFTCLSGTPPWSRFTLLKDSSTACKRCHCGKFPSQGSSSKKEVHSCFLHII